VIDGHPVRLSVHDDGVAASSAKHTPVATSDETRPMDSNRTREVVDDAMDSEYYPQNQ